VLRLITLAHDVEDVLLKGVQKTEQGAYLSLDPKLAEPIISSIKEETEKALAKNIQPVLITSPTVRRHVKKMIEHFVPSLIVLSQSELLSDIKIKSIGEVSLHYAN
jgi:flagellar biosynthesis protein FlhA